LEALENHLAHIEGKKVSSQSLPFRQQTEQNFVVPTSDDPQRVLEEEAKALAQFNQKRETTSPPPPVTTQTAVHTNGNGYGETDFFSQKPPANGQQQQLLTDDLFSLAAPSTQTNTNAFPAFPNAFETSAPKQNFFDDILQPTSTSTTKPTVPPVTSNPVAVKPLQSGDLNSSLNQLIDNLDMKDHSKIGKDHQWNPNDAKNQQKIGMSAGSMHTPGTTWANPPPMTASYSGAGVQPSNMWQQQPPPPSMNNPFAASNGSSQMNLGGTNNHSANGNHNPFAAPTSFGGSMINQQQVNDPFGSL